MYVAVVAALQVAASMDTTTTSAVTEPFSWEELEETYLKLRKEFEDLPTKFICATNVYAKLLQTAKEYRKGPYDGWTMFGLDVEVDPDMKPGEWKFEYRKA